MGIDLFSLIFRSGLLLPSLNLGSRSSKGSHIGMGSVSSTFVVTGGGTVGFSFLGLVLSFAGGLVVFLPAKPFTYDFD